MDARNLINRQRKTKGRGFLTKARVNPKGINRGAKRKGAISDLREVINQRGQQSVNVRSRLGFKSNVSMKAKTRGLQSKAAKSRALRNSGNPNKRLTVGSTIPRVVVKGGGNVRRDQSSSVTSRWRQRRGGRVDTLTVSDVVNQSPVSAVILAPSGLMSGAFQLPTMGPVNTPQIGGTVLITNLNSTITETDLLELFGDVGELSSLQMVNSSTALVTYRNKTDADRACQTYNNRLLDGYPMSCTVLPPTGTTTQPAVSTRIGNRSGSAFAQRTTATQAFMDSGLLPRRSKKDVQFTVKI